MEWGRFLFIVSGLLLFFAVCLGSVFSLVQDDSSDDSVQVFGNCSLVGDNEPCDTVSLSEVVSLINQWTRGEATLRDVVRLINAWTGATTTTTTVTTTTTPTSTTITSTTTTTSTTIMVAETRQLNLREANMVSMYRCTGWSSGVCSSGWSGLTGTNYFGNSSGSLYWTAAYFDISSLANMSYAVNNAAFNYTNYDNGVGEFTQHLYVVNYTGSCASPSITYAQFSANMWNDTIQTNLSSQFADGATYQFNVTGVIGEAVNNNLSCVILGFRANWGESTSTARWIHSPKLTINYSLNSGPVITSCNVNDSLINRNENVTFTLAVAPGTYALDSFTYSLNTTNYTGYTTNSSNNYSLNQRIGITTSGTYNYVCHVNDSTGSTASRTGPTVTIFNGNAISPEVLVIKLLNTSGTAVVVNISTNQTRNITLQIPQNFTNTYLNVSQKLFSNLDGPAGVTIVGLRNSTENFSRRFIINLTDSDTSELLDSLLIETTILSYPRALFSDISTTPGYKYQNTEPWKSWAAHLNASCGSSYVGIDNTSGCAMAYLLSNSEIFKNRGINNMINAYVQTFLPQDVAMENTEASTCSRVLMHECIAYDMLEPYLNDSTKLYLRSKIANATGEKYGFILRGKTYQSHDYDMKYIPAIGVCAMILSDLNPSEYSANKSNVSSWLKIGTDGWFYNLSGYNYTSGIIPDSNAYQQVAGIDGFDVMGAYKAYIQGDIYVLTQVYGKLYDQNVMYNSPVIEDYELSYITMLLPDKTSNNFGEMSRTCWDEAVFYMNLMNDSDPNKNISWWSRNSLPAYCDYTGTPQRLDPLGQSTKYHYAVAMATYENYTNNYSTQAPRITDTLGDDRLMYILRKDWSNNSLWASMYSNNRSFNDGRYVGQNDVFHIDYYSKGDYVLADSSEIKNNPVTGVNTLGYYYGGAGRFHNIVVLSKNLTTYLSGVMKADTNRQLISHTTGKNTLSNEKFGFIELSQMIPAIENTSANRTVINNANYWDSLYNMSESNLLLRRSMLSPNKDYLLVLDFVNNSEQRFIGTNWVLSSYNLMEVADPVWGYFVNGTLSIDNSSYNWTNLTWLGYVNFTDSNRVLWNTTSINSVEITTELFSVPASNLSLTKEWMRLGGGTSSYEVFRPMLTFYNNYTGNYHRITAISTETSANLIFSEIVNSGGIALKAKNSSTEQITTQGDGIQVAGIIKTDANISWSDNQSNVWSGFLHGGSYLNASTFFCLVANNTINYALVNSSANKTTVRVNADRPTNITVLINGTCDGSITVVKTGAAALTYGDTFGCPAINLVQFKANFSSDSEYVITY